MLTKHNKVQGSIDTNLKFHRAGNQARFRFQFAIAIEVNHDMNDIDRPQPNRLNKLLACHFRVTQKYCYLRCNISLIIN